MIYACICYIISILNDTFLDLKLDFISRTLSDYQIKKVLWKSSTFKGFDKVETATRDKSRVFKDLKQVSNRGSDAV